MNFYSVLNILEENFNGGRKLPLTSFPIQLPQQIAHYFKSQSTFQRVYSYNKILKNKNFFYVCNKFNIFSIDSTIKYKI